MGPWFACQRFRTASRARPGYLHGGIIATLLDEAMSKSVRARGLTAMTRQMEVEYLRPVHSGAPIRLEGRLVRSEGRKHWSEARILNQEVTFWLKQRDYSSRCAAAMDLE
jgi:uncharacterized protein (TIGR00369 family)